MPTSLLGPTFPATAGGSLITCDATTNTVKTATASETPGDGAGRTSPRPPASDAIVDSASSTSSKSRNSNTVKPVTWSYQSRNRLVISSTAPTEATSGPTGTCPRLGEEAVIEPRS